MKATSEPTPTARRADPTRDADGPGDAPDEPLEYDHRQPTGERRAPRAEQGSLLRWLHPGGNEWGTNLSDFDPEAVEDARRSLGLVFGPRRYFPVRVRGWEHVPDAPTMVVSNHSGGTLFLDTWGLGWAWYTHFGTTRPIHPAAHEMILGNRITGPFMSKRGVIRADRRLARRVLTEWRRDMLVMPGGDLDVWRPYTKRFEVQFAGRTGYARLALQAGVPIVPLANAGAHETFMVLSDGRRFAEAIGLPNLARAHIWPVHLSLPWGLAIGPVPHLPLPTRLRYRFGPAIHPEEVGVGPGDEPTDAQVKELDARVRASVQCQLDELRDGG